MIVRESRPEDIEAITSIYNDVILTTTAVYSEEPVSVENRLDWWQTRRAQGWPVLVATEAEDVVGFATFGEFRPWPGYRYTVEHSVHVRADRRGLGLGTLLLRSLLPLAAQMGKHMMVAGVDAANAHSIHVHEKLGFQRVGQFREVGFKFGRRLDLVFLQRRCADSLPGSFAR